MAKINRKATPPSNKVPKKPIPFDDHDLVRLNDFWIGLESLKTLAGPAEEPVAYFLNRLASDYGDIMEDLNARGVR